MIRKKRNPSQKLAKIADQILKYTDNYGYLAEGVEGDVFYFDIFNLTQFKNIKLPSEEYPEETVNFQLYPGEYVLKVFRLLLRNKEIAYYEQLSDLRLIPEIYYVSSNIMIIKYIKGKTLRLFLKNKNKSIIEETLLKVEKMILTWHKLGFTHGDISDNNILITPTGKIYFIDPQFGKSEEYDKINMNLIYMNYIKGGSMRLLKW